MLTLTASGMILGEDTTKNDKPCQRKNVCWNVKLLPYISKGIFYQKIYIYTAKT
jgi:hypothetical protein